MNKVWKILISLKKWKDIDPSEKLTRFIFDKREFNQKENRVKYQAFMPNEKNTELSVFRIKELNEKQIWDIGNKKVGRKRPQKLKARGDIKSIAVLDSNLTIDPDAFPRRHANIIGWPNEKSAIKLKAIELSEKAILFLR